MDTAATVISVITIVKNNEQLLSRAIDSVLSQTFRDFEYIIVNDGSTDGTRAIIEKYAEKDLRIKFVHMHQNVGRAMARNIGMKEAQGRYIFFLDSDDYLPDTAFMTLFKTAEQDNADIVFAGIQAFNQKTQQLEQFYYTDHFIDHERHAFRLDEYPALVRNHSVVGRLYRRRFLEKNNIRFDTAYMNVEDITFAFYTAFSAKSMTIIPERKLYYYSSGNFLARANESKLFASRDSVIEILNFVKKYGSKELLRTVQAKSIIYAGNLGKAKAVYGMSEKFKAFLPSLVPLVEDIPGDVLKTLSPYCKDFAQYLVAGDFEKAFLLFSDRGQLTSKKGDVRKKRRNEVQNRKQMFFHLLDNDASFLPRCLTAPLRAAINMMRGR